MPSICFFTICGGGEEYEFLLGSIKHHSRMGRHVVIDTALPDQRRTFKNLPPSVLWLQEPNFGYGWKDFNSRAALTRANQVAQWSRPDVIIYVDCDEWMDGEILCRAVPLAETSMVSLDMHHWRTNGKVHRFGITERHRKMWPGSMRVNFPQNYDWINRNPLYNGNPNRHIAPEPADGSPVQYVKGPILQHVHYALGQKATDEETAKSTIVGWPHGVSVAPVEWPGPLARWRDEGVHPSVDFL